MNKKIIDNLNQLPALNKTIIEIEKIKDLPEIGSKEIVKIIEKDPMETVNLLKSANHPSFQNNKEIKNIQQLISLFGITKTFAMLLDNNVKRLLSVDMKAYGVSPEEFVDISIMQSALIKKWYEIDGEKNSDEIFLAALVQEIGKIVISDSIVGTADENDFKEDIKNTNNIEEIEEAYTNYSTIDITIEILNKLGIEQQIKAILIDSKNPLKANPKNQKQAKELNIIRTAIPINKPLSKTAIDFALKKAKYFDLDTKKLEQAINFIKASK